MRSLGSGNTLQSNLRVAACICGSLLFGQQPVAGQTLPNLVVDNIEVTPAVVTAGVTSATVKVTWRNAGSGSVPSTQRICLSVEINPPVGWWSEEACSYGAAPGFSTYKLFFPPVFPGTGDYFVSALIDSRSEVNESNNSDNSRNFIVRVTPPADVNPPPRPSHLSPANGSTGTDNTPTLDWTNVTDPEGSGTNYDVQVATSTNFSSPLRSATSLTGSSWEVAPALSGNTYYWRVRAKDYAGNASAWTAPWSFTLPAPPTLTLTQPSTNVTVPRGQSLTIQWDGTDPDSNATVSVGYDLDQIFDNGNHTWVSIGLGEDGATAWNTSGVANGDYYVFGLITDELSSAHGYASGRVTVIDPVYPDLTASISTAVPQTVAPGGKVVAGTVFRNQGAGPAGPSSFRAFLSTDPDPANFSGTELSVWIGPERPIELQSSAVPSIAPNSPLGLLHLGFKVPLAAPVGGPYWLKIKVDSEGVVSETSDTNNVAVAPLSVNVLRPSYGTTILTHGYAGFGSCPIDWMVPMAEAIRRRAGKGQILFYQKNPSDPSNGLWSDTFEAGENCEHAYSPANNVSGGETILIFNWIEESDRSSNGWSEAAADALFAALLQGARAGRFPLEPLHFIGHSRGTVVNSETVERLLSRGFEVDQVTNLDPHWWGFCSLFSDDWDVNARHNSYAEDAYFPAPSPVLTWAGVRVSDSYYQDRSLYPRNEACGDGLSYLPGEAVPGGANLDLSLTSESINHSEVHAWYHFTIDPDPEVATNGVIPEEGPIHLGTDWFLPASGICTSHRSTVYARESDGYSFSRIGGADGRYASCEEAITNPTTPRFGAGEAEQESFVSGIHNDLDLAGESGWEQHGGSAQVIVPEGGIESPHLLLREAVDALHNRQVVPPNAVGLSFELKASPNPIGSNSPDDVVRVSLGQLLDLAASPPPAAWTSYSSPALNLGWVPHFLPVEAAFRGHVTSGVRFDLVRGGTTVDHEVAVGGVEWVFASLPSAVPTALHTTSVISSQVDLSWNDNSSDETAFKVERKDGTLGTWTTVGLQPANATSFRNTGLAPCSTYFYRVRSLIGGLESEPSNEVQASTSCDCVATVSPANVTAPASGTSGLAAVSVPAHCSWAPTSNVGWASATASGSNLSYTVQPNATTAQRTAVVTLHPLGVTLTIVQAAGTAPPPTNLLTNPSFEQGTSGWTCNGCTHVRDFGVVGDGLESALISARAGSWAGPTQTITHVLANGQSYQVSGLVRTTRAQGSTARFTFYLSTSAGVQYVAGPQGNASATQFSEISGAVTLTWTGTLLEARLYVETLGDSATFYFDKAYLGGQPATPPPPPPPANLLSNPSFELGASGWTCNGCTHVREYSVVADGQESARLTSRAGSWAGPTQTITQHLTNGATYSLSALVRTTRASGSTARFTVYLSTSSGVQYVAGPQAAVSASSFSQIAGNVTLQWSGTLQEARLYIETSGDSDAFYTDRVEMIRLP